MRNNFISEEKPWRKGTEVYGRCLCRKEQDSFVICASQIINGFKQHGEEKQRKKITQLLTKQ